MQRPPRQPFAKIPPPKPGEPPTLRVHNSGHVYTLPAGALRTTIGAVKKGLEKYVMMHKEHIRLLYKDRELQDHMTFPEIGFNPAVDHLELVTNGQQRQGSPAEPTTELRVINTENNKEFVLKVKCSDPSGLKVSSLKMAIAGETGIPPEEQTLTHKGVELRDTCAGVNSHIYLTRVGGQIQRGQAPLGRTGQPGGTHAYNQTVTRTTTSTAGFGAMDRNTLRVHDQNGKVYTLSAMSLKMTIGAVKKNLERYAELRREEMHILYKGRELNDEATCKSIGFFAATDYLELARDGGGGRGGRPRPSPFTNASTAQQAAAQEVPFSEIRVINTEDNKEFALKIRCNDLSGLKVSSLKTAMAAKTNIPPEEQTLTHKGAELPDTGTCAGVDGPVYLSKKFASPQQAGPLPAGQPLGNLSGDGGQQAQQFAGTVSNKVAAQYQALQGLRIVDDNAKVYTLKQKGLDMLAMPIGNIKQVLVKDAELPKEEILLFYKGRELTDKATCKGVGFVSGVDTLQLRRKDEKKSVKPPEGPDTNTEAKTAQGKAVTVVNVNQQTEHRMHTQFANLVNLKVDALKTFLARETSIPVDQQVLLYRGREITDHCGGIEDKIYLSKVGDPPPDVAYIEEVMAARKGDKKDDAPAGADPSGTNDMVPVRDTGDKPCGVVVEYVTAGGVKQLRLDGSADMFHVKGRHLKAALKNDTKLDTLDMELRWEGKVLSDEQTCMELGLKAGDKLQLVTTVDPTTHLKEARNVRVVNLNVKPHKEYAVHSVGADVSIMTGAGIKKALSHLFTYEEGSRLYLDNTELLDDQTCRDLKPAAPDYTLFLCERPPETIVSSFLLDPNTPAIQLEHSPVASIGNIRELLRKTDALKHDNFYLTFQGNPCSDLEPVGVRRVFGVVKTTKTHRNMRKRRFSMPEGRVMQKFYRMEVNMPRDPWLAFGFRVGAWEGLERSSAAPTARWGRALKHYQKDRVFQGRKRSASQVAMPTDMPSDTWFQQLGYRLPVVLTLPSKTRVVLEQRVESPIRFTAGELVPHPSPTRKRLEEEPQSPVAGSPYETRTQGVTTTAHEDERERQQEQGWEQENEEANEKERARMKSTTRYSSTGPREARTQSTSQQAHGIDWKTLSGTMKKTHHVAMGLSHSKPAEGKTPHDDPERLHTNRGKVLATPQALRAASLHRTLAPTTGSTWGTAKGERTPSASGPVPNPVFTSTSNPVDRLTMIENILTSRSNTTHRTVPK
eukprot:TRINITY_DN14670_c0_g1_i1.p1 TRINITY_DN14670_c0_g1~~TRINITY_DN14670_c0_g1_i1.p1  ORF type:complete len:1235 (+),score=271.65 TRINITY_DN14670_c0_g1_i1:58-3762(+)